jgi:hypothetical protein
VIRIQTPKPTPRKREDLEQPWHEGDPIPAPEALHGDGESAWALWNQVAKQQEHRFAPTAPAGPPTISPSGPVTMSHEERSWAATRPASRPASAKKPQAPRRDPEPLFTLDSAMLVARRNNRVCPRPPRWAEFFALLPVRKTLRGVQQPPAPITGAAWAVTPSLSKRLCFREQIEWAERAGILEDVMAFLQCMPEGDWLHMSEV